MLSSFFHLSNSDPEKGFSCDLSAAAGCIYGAADQVADLENRAYLRMLLGSHLANYLRLKIEEDFGFTSSCGISCNKLLSKLAGTENKPRNQTTLFALSEDDAVSFMDHRPIRTVPGIGSRMTYLLESRLLTPGAAAAPHTMDCTLTVHDVRAKPGASPGFLEKILAGTGYEKGIGDKIWDLLHGVDFAEVKQASDIPTQISIEDTFRELDSIDQIAHELKKLGASLVRRMRNDLLGSDDNPDEQLGQRWMARPKTLRLTVRSSDTDKAVAQNFSRTSKSQPLPSFVFSLKDGVDEIAERLAADVLLPMLRRIYPEKGHRWNLNLINICIANIDDAGKESRDISVMFRKQDEVLRQWKVDTTVVDDVEAAGVAGDSPVSHEDTSEASWGDDANLFRCAQCGHLMPPFALLAHARFHELEEQNGQ